MEWISVQWISFELPEEPHSDAYCASFMSFGQQLQPFVIIL